MTKIKSVPKKAGKRARPPVQNLPSVGGEPQEEGPRGRLFIEPKDLREKADQLGAVAPLIGGPLSDMNYEEQSAQEEQYVLVVDPHVLTTGDLDHNEVLSYAEVQQRSGVDPGEHQARWQQVKAAANGYIGAQQRSQDIQDSLAVVGQDNRMLRGKLREAIPHALAKGLIPEGERAAVRVAWQRIEAEEQKELQRKQDARAASTAQTEQASAAKDKAQRRDDLVHTILDLRQGREVDPARAAEAVRTYDEMQAEQQAAAENDATATQKGTSGRRGRPR